MNETEYLKFRRAIIRGEEDARADTVQLVLADGTLYEHPGIVETVEGDFERQTGSIAFRARFPNPEGLLKHGVSGKINMMTKMDDVYLIPQQATFEIQEFTYVYTINDENVAKVRSFETAGQIQRILCSRKLRARDRNSIFQGIQRLKDGMKIKPVETSGTDSGETEDTAPMKKPTPIQKNSRPCSRCLSKADTLGRHLSAHNMPGIDCAQLLPITQFPDIVPPSVTVTARYTGASADVMSKTVATPLERAINGVPGMTYMTTVTTNIFTFGGRREQPCQQRGEQKEEGTSGGAKGGG